MNRRSQALKIGTEVQSIPDADFGVIKQIDRKDGMALVAWGNGQETWASNRNLRAA